MPAPRQHAQRTATALRHTLTGHFDIHTAFRSHHLPDTRDVLVWLPRVYDREPHRRFPVLYLQDGQNLFDGATSYIPGQEWHVDETAESLVRRGLIEPVIIVGVYHTGIHRIDEYTPSFDPAHGAGGKAHLYGRLLTEELKPFIDARYRTLPDGANTGIGGSSLGGLVSLHLSLEYPHQFGKAAVMSPSIWWHGREILQRVHSLERKLPLRIWLDFGTHEGRTKAKSRQYLQDAEDLRDALIGKGWSLGVDLEWMEAKGAGHNEGAFAARVEPILRFLFPAG